jgi:hypothetical protein
MKLDSTEKGKLKTQHGGLCRQYDQGFSSGITTINYTWNDNLFKVNPSSKLLTKEKKDLFHTFIDKALFLCKRA